MRYFIGLGLGILFFAILAASTSANGGLLVHREQQGGYDIAVTVWPPEPKTGLLVFTVLIQAVVSANGGGDAHFAPISTDLSLRGDGPLDSRVGPFQPQTVLPGFSHFDVRIPVGREGQWTFTFAVTGPLGDVETTVPLEVLPSDEGSAAVWWVVVTSAAVVSVLGVVLFGIVRRNRRSSAV